MTPARVEFPRKLHFLLRERKRYKVAYGGRGGAKSWGFARALLILGAQTKLRILCARETQKSIADSVHKLLSDQIGELGLRGAYTVEKARILGANGTEIIFAGLRHNIDNIKSLEACDIVWVEEAQSVSKASWEKLIPTIRKNGSEIWVSFNPDLETDDTYQRFVVKTPASATVVKIDWRDNPWFPDVLNEERLTLRAQDLDSYNHVWEGSCISLLAGAIYASEMRAADKDNRITRVPYDRTRPVDCYWDLGFGDLAAVWMVQAFPFEYRLIDYIENRAKSIQWFLQEMQTRGYLFGNDWLPWDLGMHAKLMGGGRSIEEIMRVAGRKVSISPRLPIADRIQAARTIFNQCWFDRERCADGIQALRHYRWGEVESTGLPTRAPLHDEFSHGADAFGYFALNARPPKKKLEKPRGAPKPQVTVWG